MAKYSNFVSVRGQLVAEPRVSQGNGPTELRILISEPKRGVPGQAPEFYSNFFTVVCWREQASEAQTLRKGDQVGVIGKLRHESFQDKQGNNREAVRIVADALSTPIVPALPPAGYQPQPSFDSMVPQPVAADDGGW